MTKKGCEGIKGQQIAEQGQKAKKWATKKCQDGEEHFKLVKGITWQRRAEKKSKNQLRGLN